MQHDIASRREICCLSAWDKLRLAAERIAPYCDPREGVVVGLRPKGPFVPLFRLCEGLVRTAPQPVEGGIHIAVPGDPEGIRTPDLHRDKVAC